MTRCLALMLALLLAACAGADVPLKPLPQPTAWKAVLIAGDDSEPAFDNAVDAMAEKLGGYGLRPEDIVVLKASAGDAHRADGSHIADAFAALTPSPSDG